MSRRSGARRAEYLLATALCAGLWSTAAVSGVCQRVEAEDSFAATDRVNSGYFDDYYIRSRRGIYFIRAVKHLSLTFSRAVKVLSKFEQYPQFMPGYKGIRVRRAADGVIYTAIRFRPDFSFFESRFTNRVEIAQFSAGYRQCWWQLQAKDPAAMEEFRAAPKVNHGYWRVTHTANGEVELRYFSAIDPPIPLPGFLYRHVVTNSYQEVFEHLVGRIRAETE